MNTTCTTPASTARSTTPVSGVTEAVRKPHYSVHSHENSYEVQIELPGVPKSGVKVDLDKNLLTVTGARAVQTPEGWTALHRELSNLNFQLRLRLNVPVAEDQLTANLDNGVLTLRLPIQEAAKPRSIEVQ